MKHIVRFFAAGAFLFGAWYVGSLLWFESSVFVAELMLDRRQPKHFVFDLHNVLIRGSFFKRLNLYLVNYASKQGIPMYKVRITLQRVYPIMFGDFTRSADLVEYGKEVKKVVLGQTKHKEFKGFLKKFFAKFASEITDSHELELLEKVRLFVSDNDLFASYAMQMLYGFKLAEKIHRKFGPQSLYVLADVSLDLLESYQKTHRQLLYLFPVEHQMCTGQIGFAKPSREVYNAFLEKMGLPAHETVYIDNVRSHVEGAERCGMIGIHCSENSVSLEALRRYLM